MNGDARTSIGTTICGRNSIFGLACSSLRSFFRPYSLTSTISIRIRLQDLFSFLGFVLFLIVCTLAPSFVRAALNAWNIVVLQLRKAVNVNYYFSKSFQNSPKVIQKMGHGQKHLKYGFGPL